MTEPTELEKRLVQEMIGLSEDIKKADMYIKPILTAEYASIETIMLELVNRRVRLEYLGQSSITGGREERID